VACADTKIYLWDALARKQTVVLEGHTSVGHLLAFNHAGTLLASNDWHRVLRLWDTRTGRQLFKAPAVVSCFPRFSPDDQLLAAEIKGTKLRLFRVAEGRELRTLTCLSVPGGNYSHLSLAADGRLLAVAISNPVKQTYLGVALLDLATGKDLKVVPIGESAPVRFDAVGGLLTHGQDGVLQWPVQEKKMPGLLCYGPPQMLAPLSGWDITGSSADGRVLALPRYHRCALLLHRDQPGKFVELAPQEDVRCCAVSSDGHWVATASHNSQSVFVKVWDGRTGKLVKDLPVAAGSFVDFSRDGRWLATHGGGCRLWAVGSWEEGPKISGEQFAFTTARCWPSRTISASFIYTIRIPAGSTPGWKSPARCDRSPGASARTAPN
jgi:WD40 repeat protein